MARRKEVRWERRKTSPEERGQDWEIGQRIRQLSSCTSTEGGWPDGTTLTVQQWRVWVGQDNSPIAPPFLLPLVLLDAPFLQVVPRRFRL